MWRLLSELQNLFLYLFLKPMQFLWTQSVLYGIMLYFAALCWCKLCCFLVALSCIMMYCFYLLSIALSCIVVYIVVLCCVDGKSVVFVVMSCIVVLFFVLCWLVLFFVLLYCAMLHCAVLYYFVLCCIVFFCSIVLFCVVDISLLVYLGCVYGEYEGVVLVSISWATLTIVIVIYCFQNIMMLKLAQSHYDWALLFDLVHQILP